MTEQELISTINELIDEHMQSGEKWTPTGLARAAIARIGKDVVTESAMIDLARQVSDARDPWPMLPGTEPRLREGVKGVDRLEHRPSLIELLHEGQEEEGMWYPPHTVLYLVAPPKNSGNVFVAAYAYTKSVGGTPDSGG